MRRLTLWVFALILLTTFLLQLVWEFHLKDLLIDGLPAVRARHWDNVWASTGLTLAALIVPLWLTLRAERRREERIGHLHQTAKVFESTTDGAMITDVDGTIQAVNRAFLDITGYREQEVLGQNPRLLNSDRQDRGFYDGVWDAIRKTGRWEGEICNRRRSGEIFPAWEAISAIRDNKGGVTHYVAVISDISALKRADERLRHLAHYDALTDLPNRVLFEDRLRHAMEHARRTRHKVAVLFIDLDGFKRVNDTIGHAIGDRLLQRVAKRLLECVRECDTVARLSGDEFTVTLESLPDREQALTVAKKIVAALSRAFVLDGHRLAVTASVGISVYPDDADNVDRLLSMADTAMYEVKGHGGNNCRLSPYDTAAAGAATARHARAQDVSLRRAHPPRFEGDILDDSVTPLVSAGVSPADDRAGKGRQRAG